VSPVYQNRGAPDAVPGLLRRASGPGHDHANRAHYAGPAAPPGALHELLFRVRNWVAHPGPSTAIVHTPSRTERNFGVRDEGSPTISATHS